MKKIYMILAAMTLLSMSLNAQTKSSKGGVVVQPTASTEMGGSMKAPNRSIINVTDNITASALAATTTTYTNFSGVTFTSDAVYAGQSAKNGNNIQLRATNPSGIVTTTSGGKVKSITITVASGTNTIRVYGKNTAYSSAADLYSNTTRGTQLGELTSTGTITVSGDYAYIGIRSNRNTVYISSIDVVWEKEVVVHDLSVALSAPATVVAGNTATLTATVTNTGDYAESGYTVTFRDDNNNVIDTQTGGALAVGADATFTTTYTTTDAQAGQTLNFTATVTCTGDGVASNDNATASTSVITLPPPENVVATAGENQTATVTWDLPIIATTPATLTWDFEEQSDLADFTTIDSDGDGYNWGWHYNTGSGNYTVNTGNGVAYSESYSNNAGAALSPDNWMISPEVTLGGTLTFYAAHQATYPEKFAVYVCQGPYSDVSSFTKIYGDITTTGTMTKHTIDLSQYAGQGYFAIRHYNVSDQFILLIDDITLEYAAGNYPISYNVYLDGVLQGNVSSSTFSYDFSNLSSGQHECSVSAVYNEGESAQVPANIPTFEPVTNGTVSPNSVYFGTQNIGGSYTATVTVTNTGNMSFTPTIDATGLPQGISVSPTTSGAVAPNGTLDLTVTFAPTADQSYSGTFTVTIPVPDDDDIVVTVTVTGSGYYGNRLTSNTTEEIPVYKSGLEPRGPYTKQEVDYDDLEMELVADGTTGKFQINVKKDSEIDHYELQRGSNWTVVAIADRQNNTFVAYDADGTTAQGESVDVSNADENGEWLVITDNTQRPTGSVSYVPVTVADGKISTGNTYGAPRTSNDFSAGSVTASVVVHKGGENQGSSWMASRTPGAEPEEYCVYIPIFDISAILPVVSGGTSYHPYMYRAWAVCPYAHDFGRDSDPNHPVLIDMGALSSEIILLDTYGQNDPNLGLEATIGEEYDNSTQQGENTRPVTAFAAPSENPDITYYVRFYYKKEVNRSVDDDEYYIVEDQPTNVQVVTHVNEMGIDRVPVSTTYVNSLGMQSDKPFEGINIVVTRYSDGTTSTVKVMR